MKRFVHFDISYSDDDDSWTVCNSPSFDLLYSDVCISDEVDCIRAIGSTSPTPVEVVLDSGADGWFYHLNMPTLVCTMKVFRRTLHMLMPKVNQ